MYISLFMCCVFLICLLNYNNKKIDTLSIDNSNSLKGIMAICVVLHHLSQQTHSILIFLDFGAIAVGCFFFISGYGLYTSYEKKGKAYLMDFPQKRFKKLIIPFILVICLYQLWLFVLNVSKGISFDDLSVGHVNAILPYSWYIFVIIIFYFTFYFAFKVANSKRGGGNFVLAGCNNANIHFLLSKIWWLLVYVFTFVSYGFIL